MKTIKILATLALFSAIFFTSCGDTEPLDPAIDTSNNGGNNGGVEPNPNAPILITTAVSSISTTTASSGGTIVSEGGDAVTARGVVWSIAPSPTTANSKT